MNLSPASAPAIEDLLPLLTRDVIDAIADRPHETEARRRERAQGAMCLIEAFEPEDGMEIMLAGHSVLMQNLMLDSIHDSRRAMTMDHALRHRQQALSMARMQLSCLKEIRLHRANHPRLAGEAPVQTASQEPETTSAVQVPPQLPIEAARTVEAQPVPVRPAQPRLDPPMPAAPPGQIRQMPPSAAAVPSRPAPALTGT